MPFTSTTFVKIFCLESTGILQSVKFLLCTASVLAIFCAIKWSIYVMLKCMALTYFEIYYQLMDTLHHTLHE